MTPRLDTYNVMIGPAKSGEGGISTVIVQYEENGFFTALNSEYWASWECGSATKKIGAVFIILARLTLGLLQRKIRIVHVHSACRISFLRKSLFVALADFLNAAVIFHLHSGEFFVRYKNSNFVTRWWVRSTLNRCAAILLLSEGWRSEMQLLVTDPKKIHVVSNPIDLKLPASFRRKARSAGQLDLLFLGEIGDRKGIFDLLPVLSELRKKGLNIRLRCGGNGQVERLMAALKKYSLTDAVDFLGWLNYEQKINEFESTDVFILPSHYEGQPMAILEAMMAGVPVISTTAGSIPDTINNNLEGFLVAPGDPIAMRAILERVYNDLHCTDELVLRAEERAENSHNPASILKVLIKIYNDIDS